MSGEINERLQEIEERLSKLESVIFSENSISDVSNTEKLIIKRISDLKVPELIILALQLRNQTKNELKQSLQDWGKPFGNWFCGGNFTQCLVKANIIKSIEKNETNKDIYSLTKKGSIMAEELLEKIKNTDNS